VSQNVRSNCNIIEKAEAPCFIGFCMMPWWSHYTSSRRQLPFRYLSRNLAPQTRTPKQKIRKKMHT
jgi:hypothetical protein